MLHLKMEQVEEVVLVTLIFPIIFLIFLKISLVILVVAEEEEVKNQILEDQILDMTYLLPWKKLIMVKNKILNFLHLKNVVLVVEVALNQGIMQILVLCAVVMAK